MAAFEHREYTKRRSMHPMAAPTYQLRITISCSVSDDCRCHGWWRSLGVTMPHPMCMPLTIINKAPETGNRSRLRRLTILVILCGKYLRVRYHPEVRFSASDSQVRVPFPASTGTTSNSHWPLLGFRFPLQPSLCLRSPWPAHISVTEIGPQLIE